MKKTYELVNLGCANCARKMGEVISELPGVERAKVNFMLSKLAIEAPEESQPSEEKIREIIQSFEPECDLK